MDDSYPPNPHDRFFREVFSRQEIAAYVFKDTLPADVVERADFQGLALQTGSFLDESLRERTSDLLFTLPVAGEDAYVYCLFEHQRHPDPHMPLRLLVYMTRIWEGVKKQDPKRSILPPIYPVVFHQGTEAWKVPLRFHETLWPRPIVASQEAPPCPDFQYVLVDVNQTGVLERFHALLVQQVFGFMRALVQREQTRLLDEAFDRLEAMERLGADPALLRTGLTYFFLVAPTLDREELVRHIVGIKSQRIKEQAMTLAEQLKQEGRQEGRLEGRNEGRSEGRKEGRQEGLREGVLGTIRSLSLILGHAPLPDADLAATPLEALIRLRDELLAEIQPRKD